MKQILLDLAAECAAKGYYMHSATVYNWDGFEGLPREAWMGPDSECLYLDTPSGRVFVTNGYGVSFHFSPVQR